MSDTNPTRRDALGMIVGGASVGLSCSATGVNSTGASSGRTPARPATIERISALPEGNTPWPTPDPFLFCVHHFDQYPAGDGKFGPRAQLAGRNIGSDFSGKDGWSMYHGQRVPGFPQHPHRGFETISVVRQGLMDHADSLGASARFGGGDVQWMTAGRGIQHSEMFPLLDESGDNPLELFQIWLNLPSASKMVDPHFKMLWGPQLPVYEKDGARVTVVAGALGDLRPPEPPPKSWAADPAHGVAIWTIALQPGARFTVPEAVGTKRTLYLHTGGDVQVTGQQLAARHLVELSGDGDVELIAGTVASELLLLQGKPIAEEVARYGPFVMNTQDEIRQAMLDFRDDQFGGWPWPHTGPVHGEQPERFAKHADGRVDRPA